MLSSMKQSDDTSAVQTCPITCALHVTQLVEKAMPDISQNSTQRLADTYNKLCCVYILLHCLLYTFIVSVNILSSQGHESLVSVRS